MKVRGRRECADCGRVWSYYETGEVACPDCGSLRSVGVDDRTRHTAEPVAFDLSPHRRRADAEGVGAVVDDARSACLAYVRKRGFIRGGRLLDLDDTVLAAGELAYALDRYDRLADPTDDEEYYLLSLLAGADRGDRPAPDEVPGSMTAGRGLAYADAVADYRREALTWLDDEGREAPGARRLLGTVDGHARRVRALDGDAPPETVERLVAAVRDVATAIRADTDGEAETALARARDRVDRLD
jgi:uncharacterized Zn finger protein (UPF0148 family)